MTLINNPLVPVRGRLMGAIPAVVPFSIRETPSLIYTVEEMRQWINDTLVPFVNENIELLSLDWKEQSEQLLLMVTEIAAGVGTNVEEAQAARVAAEAAAALAEQYASEAAEVQDTAITSIFSNVATSFRQLADATYVAPADLEPYATTAEVNATLEPISESVGDLETLTGSGRLSDEVLKSEFPIYRVWTGAAYPARVPNAVNIFFGPTDPGLAMGAGDYWANSAVTTLAEVAAAVQNPASALYAAIQAVTVGSYVDIPLTLRQGDTAQFKSSGIAGLYGWEALPNVTTVLAGNIEIPYGWSTARVRMFYVSTVAPSGDLRLTREGSAYRSTASARNIPSVTNTAPVGAVNVVTSYQFPSDMDVTAMQHISVEVRRAGTTSGDTFESPIFILSARLEKVA